VQHGTLSTNPFKTPGSSVLGSLKGLRCHLMTYGDRALLLHFANKVRAASLQHGPGHYLMSGNPTSEIGPTERRKAMDESWMAAQTEILSAERFSAEAMEMTSLLRLMNRSTRHCASGPIDQAYALPGLAYGGGASELDPRFDQTVAEAYIQTRRYIASRNQAKFLHAAGAPNEILGFPPWVPDGRYTTSAPCSTQKAHHPTIPLNPYLLYPGSRILTCCGEILDSLQTFASEFQYPEDLREWVWNVLMVHGDGVSHQLMQSGAGRSEPGASPL
jgi:hypothetical protein